MCVCDGFSTFDTSQVVAYVLVESVCIGLLDVEVLEVLVEYLVCGPVSLAKVLQQLEKERKGGDMTEMTRQFFSGGFSYWQTTTARPETGP